MVSEVTGIEGKRYVRAVFGFRICSSEGSDEYFGFADPEGGYRWPPAE
jgi:hypothetical protein